MVVPRRGAEAEERAADTEAVGEGEQDAGEGVGEQQEEGGQRSGEEGGQRSGA